MKIIIEFDHKIKREYDVSDYVTEMITRSDAAIQMTFCHPKNSEMMEIKIVSLPYFFFKKDSDDNSSTK